jgi:hypothetical protein
MHKGIASKGDTLGYHTDGDIPDTAIGSVCVHGAYCRYWEGREECKA